jgi:hypothetical protein
MEPSEVPMGGPSIQDMAKNLQKLEENVEKLTEALTKNITTIVSPGQANLDNGKKEEVVNDGEKLDFGLNPRNVTSRLSHMTNRRSTSMLRKRKLASQAPGRKRQAEDVGVVTPPDETLLKSIEEATPQADGTKPFYKREAPATGEAIKKEVETTKKEEGVAEVLYPKASVLRAARKARLGLAFETLTTSQGIPAGSKESADLILMAAEKKASDLAALHVTKYGRALELAFLAQEKGQVASPLLDKLQQRLAAAGVPDAELLAVQVLEGANSDNLKVAHNAALGYMDMDDSAFLHVQKTIHDTPSLAAHGFVPTDRQRVAQEVRSAAIKGNLPVQATSAPAGTGLEALRARIRQNTPRLFHSR